MQGELLSGGFNHMLCSRPHTWWSAALTPPSPCVTNNARCDLRGRHPDALATFPAPSAAAAPPRRRAACFLHPAAAPRHPCCPPSRHAPPPTCRVYLCWPGRCVMVAPAAAGRGSVLAPAAAVCCARLLPLVLLAAAAADPPPPRAACTSVGLDAVCWSLLPPQAAILSCPLPPLFFAPGSCPPSSLLPPWRTPPPPRHVPRVPLLGWTLCAGRPSPLLLSQLLSPCRRVFVPGSRPSCALLSPRPASPLACDRYPCWLRCSLSLVLSALLRAAAFFLYCRTAAPIRCRHQPRFSRNRRRRSRAFWPLPPSIPTQGTECDQKNEKTFFSRVAATG